VLPETALCLLDVADKIAWQAAVDRREAKDLGAACLRA
jgi:hypothetical protein